MNLEIATRLVGLRKANNLSQEALAEKLGISRQAVSKWERAEASPDTDNLIALARLYHVSLDELLKINDEEENDVGACEGTYGNAGQASAPACHDSVIKGETLADNGRTGCDAYGEDGQDGPWASGEGEDFAEQSGTEENGWNSADGSAGDGLEDDVHIGFRGIHVKERNGDEVHIGWDGIHVHDKDNDVHIDKNGIIVNGEEARKHLFMYERERAEFPLGILAIVIYIVIGIFFDLWHPGWILFFLVPVISSLIHAVRKGNANLFAYPVFVLFIFLYMGFVHFRWHPTWVLFLTIPLYYPFVGYWRDRKERKEGEW